MRYTFQLIPYELVFIEPAGTSRGVYKTRKTWFVKLFHATNKQIYGMGECAPLPNLSCDFSSQYESLLRTHCERFCHEGEDYLSELRAFPSILFGLETALLQLKAGGKGLFYDTAFTRMEEGIRINGLVWMGSFEQMMQRLEDKLSAGFQCIKFKIGAIDFQQELKLLAAVRERYDESRLEIRVDANGAFKTTDVEKCLDKLSAYNVHSIEQPIAPKNYSFMRKLCLNTPIPIALDEELIGINETKDKISLLEEINPHYIILKPSLHGGISGATEWINLARERGILSWSTSALESNVGLNAIAQWTSFVYSQNERLPQGLGTGMLYTNNIEMPLLLKKDELWYSKSF